jgi:trimethylamine:corrinoid methyltransferase-like protein
MIDGIQNSFLASDLTSRRFRDWYYDSRIFHRFSLNAFECSDKKDALDLAEEIAVQALSHEPVPVVDDRARRAMDEVYQNALRFFNHP